MRESYYQNRFLRTSRRLNGWDYTRDGFYFVTICTAKRAMLLGNMINGQMELNEFGEIAADEWKNTFEIRENINPDKFIVMPNHIHVIIALHSGTSGAHGSGTSTGTVMACESGTVMARHDAANHPKNTSSFQKFGNPISGSISTIIGAYKSSVTKRINILRNTSGETIWQPRFHDRIIRTKKELDNVRKYIEQNPANWGSDKHNTFFKVAGIR